MIALWADNRVQAPIEYKKVFFAEQKTKLSVINSQIKLDF